MRVRTSPRSFALDPDAVEVQVQFVHSPIERNRHRRIENDPLPVNAEPGAERRKSLGGHHEATDQLDAGGGRSARRRRTRGPLRLLLSSAFGRLLLPMPASVRPRRGDPEHARLLSRSPRSAAPETGPSKRRTVVYAQSWCPLTPDFDQHSGGGRVRVSVLRRCGSAVAAPGASRRLGRPPEQARAALAGWFSGP